jgi:hypothetical protein
MSRTPPLRFGKLRSKFPEDPTEHHAAMRLGSLELAPRPSATKDPPGAPSRACLQRGFGLAGLEGDVGESLGSVSHGSMKLAWALSRCSNPLRSTVRELRASMLRVLQKLPVE